MATNQRSDCKNYQQKQDLVLIFPVAVGTGGWVLEEDWEHERWSDGDVDTHIMQGISRCVDTIGEQTGDPCKKVWSVGLKWQHVKTPTQKEHPRNMPRAETINSLIKMMLAV